VNDSALAPPIGDFDEEFFDSQEVCDGIERESSYDELSEDDFDDVDKNMDPTMSLEDVLPWPPELQFCPESLHAHNRHSRGSARGKVVENTANEREPNHGHWEEVHAKMDNNAVPSCRVTAAPLLAEGAWTGEEGSCKVQGERGNVGGELGLRQADPSGGRPGKGAG
jgi:hypothetical protein